MKCPECGDGLNDEERAQLYDQRDTLTASLSREREESERLRGELARVVAQKDGAYQERDKLVAAFLRAARALGCFVWRGYHAGENWDNDWRNIIFIELPTGQVSWHIHDSELPMFADVPEGGAGCIWDGHDTPEKYQRLLKWDAGLSAMGQAGSIADRLLTTERSLRERAEEALGEALGLLRRFVDAASAEDWLGRMVRVFEDGQKFLSRHPSSQPRPEGDGSGEGT